MRDWQYNQRFDGKGIVINPLTNRENINLCPTKAFIKSPRKAINLAGRGKERVIVPVKIEKKSKRVVFYGRFFNIEKKRIMEYWGVKRRLFTIK